MSHVGGFDVADDVSVAFFMRALIDMGRGSIAEVSPAPIASSGGVDSGQSALLVATLANGTVETQWLPEEMCERVVLELRTGSAVAGVTADGTRLPIERANCSLRSAQLADPTPALPTP